MNSWNLALRGGLELSALVAMSSWAYNLNDEKNIAYAIALPVLVASIWGVFAVSGDPSRSGNTVVETAGWLRLVIETSVFAFGAYTLHDLGHQKLAYTFTGLTVLHYSLSLDRIKWLLEQ